MRILLIVVGLLVLLYFLGLSGLIHVDYFLVSDNEPTFSGEHNQFVIDTSRVRLSDTAEISDIDSQSFPIRFRNDEGLRSSIGYSNNRIGGSLALNSLKLVKAWYPYYKPSHYTATMILDSLYFLHFLRGRKVLFPFTGRYQVEGNFPYIGVCSGNHARQVLFEFLCGKTVKWLESQYREQAILVDRANR